MSVFFDTNVILYAMGDDDVRVEIAGGLLRAGGWISVQVLNELMNSSRRKLKHSWDRTREILAVAKGYTFVCDLTVKIHERGVDIAERYKLSTYDAIIVAAAINTGCETLYSEDMHHGLVVDGQLRIVNPFLPN